MRLPPLSMPPAPTYFNGVALDNPISEVRSIWIRGRTLYVKRLGDWPARPLSLVERLMLAEHRLRPGNEVVAIEKAGHTPPRRYLISWSLEALQSGFVALPNGH
jgi:hypothetical protein